MRGSSFSVLGEAALSSFLWPRWKINEYFFQPYSSVMLTRSWRQPFVVLAHRRRSKYFARALVGDGGGVGGGCSFLFFYGWGCVVGGRGWAGWHWRYINLSDLVNSWTFIFLQQELLLEQFRVIYAVKLSRTPIYLRSWDIAVCRFWRDTRTTHSALFAEQIFRVTLIKGHRLVCGEDICRCWHKPLCNLK